MKAFYICGTHWDREWYEPFQEYRMWLVQNLDDIMDRLQANPEYKVFHLDGQAVMIEDYLEIRPERREELQQLLADRRLIAGPWYAMPDLWLVSGEALIRNLMLGMHTIRELGAEPMKVGYTPDLFGHISSMPTIFTGLGLDCAVVWRGLNDGQVPAQFIWVGADGSKLLVHRLPDNAGYPWFNILIRGPWTQSGFDSDVLKDSARTVISEEQERVAAPALYLSDTGDHQTMPDQIPEMLELMSSACPDVEFVHASMEDYFAELERHREGLSEFHGELRYVARRTGMLYFALIPHCLSSRYPLKQANDRCQNLLQLWAEPMAAYASTAGHALPPGYLETAWKWLLKNQPHDSICGCSTDETHADMPFRFHQAESIADGLRRQAMACLSAPSDNLASSIRNIAVWNPIPHERHQVCELDLYFPADYPAKALRSGHTGAVLNQFDLLGPDGNTVPYQVLDVLRDRTVKVPNAQGRRLLAGAGLDVYRIAAPLDLPAAGFTSLTVRPLEGVGALKRMLGTLRTGPLEAANEHFSVEVRENGTVKLHHPESGRTYPDLFGYEDSGDAGDGWSFIPPVRNAAVVSSGHAVQVGVEEDGPFQVTFRIERFLRVPVALDQQQPERRSEELVEMPVTDYLTVREGDPSLHVRTVIDNTARDHRLRVLFPSDIDADEYWSDQPFNWVCRPVATDPGSAEYKEPDPVERPNHTAFAICGDAGGLAVLCPEGLHEHTIHEDRRRTLALTLFRGIHETPQTDGEEGPQVLGKMQFCYALQPFSGPLPCGRITRRVQELQAGVYWHLTATAGEAASFMNIAAADSVSVSAIKPAAHGDGIILRFWNCSEHAQDVRISMAAAVSSACLCDLKEDRVGEVDVSEDAVNVQVPARGLATVRIETAACKL